MDSLSQGNSDASYLLPAVRRQVVSGEIVPEQREKKWCRLCHGTHALPECGMPTDAPELLVIDVDEER